MFRRPGKSTSFESLTTAELDAQVLSRRHPLALAILAHRDRWFKITKDMGVELDTWTGDIGLGGRTQTRAHFFGTTSESIEVDVVCSVDDRFIRAYTADEVAAKEAEHEALYKSIFTPGREG